MPRFYRRVTAHLEGRLAITTIVGFAMFSATFALATAVAPSRAARAAAAEPRELIAAELEVRELVDERIHMHLKRMHELAPAGSLAQ